MIDVKIEDNTAQSITSAQCVNVPYLFRRTARCRRLSPRAADTGAAPCRASPRRCWAGRGAAPGRAASTPCWRGSSLTAGTPRAPGTPTPPSTGPCPGETWTPWTGGWHIHLTHEHTQSFRDYEHFLFPTQGRDEVRGEVVQRDDHPARDAEAAVGRGLLGGEPQQPQHEDQRGREDDGGEGRRILLRGVAAPAALQASRKHT